MAKFVYHHALENVGLVVDVVKYVAPEWVKCLWWNQEACTNMISEIMVVHVKKGNIPPVHIHKPLAKAVPASATTKMGMRLLIRTTSDSAAIKSRKSHMIQVKKASALGRKFESQ